MVMKVPRSSFGVPKFFLTKFRVLCEARKADERRQVGCFFDALSFGQRGQKLDGECIQEAVW